MAQGKFLTVEELVTYFVKKTAQGKITEHLLEEDSCVVSTAAVSVVVDDIIGKRKRPGEDDDDDDDDMSKKWKKAKSSPQSPSESIVQTFENDDGYWASALLQYLHEDADQNFEDDNLASADSLGSSHQEDEHDDDVYDWVAALFQESESGLKSFPEADDGKLADGRGRVRDEVQHG